MLLWNDYEGKMIDGKYLVGPLLGPEGRSALFTVAQGTDAAATIAITEALNDEDQMIGFWGRIAAVTQENLLPLKEFGRTEFEGTPLAYVVMEGLDGTLADLLKERTVSHDEGIQIGVSVSRALQALHAAGIAHGHVVAENVVAVGETVKLRTDCVRDPGEVSAEELEERLRKDVQDLSLLLLRALTLEKVLTPDVKLAAPFRRVVANGGNGTWGLAQMEGVMAPAVERPVVSVAPEPVQYSLPIAEEISVMEEPVYAPATIGEKLAMRRIRTEIVPFAMDRRFYGVAAAFAVVLMVLFGVHLFRGKPLQSTAKVVETQEVAAPAPVVAANEQPVKANKMDAGWYVIAYTYNHEDQAWKMVQSIMRRHPALAPKVVSPGEHGPFLVAIGGPMTRDGAATARMKAVHQGMPRDTFVRNYGG